MHCCYIHLNCVCKWFDLGICTIHRDRAYILSVGPLQEHFSNSEWQLWKLNYSTLYKYRIYAIICFRKRRIIDHTHNKNNNTMRSVHIILRITMCTQKHNKMVSLRVQLRSRGSFHTLCSASNLWADCLNEKTNSWIAVSISLFYQKGILFVTKRWKHSW